ncbi:hypothetical protein P8452_42790 [Trifolium repens]|nr:hypothetical protein P8452_42790 [Trifolium repens]
MFPAIDPFPAMDKGNSHIPLSLKTRNQDAVSSNLELQTCQAGYVSNTKGGKHFSNTLAAILMKLQTTFIKFCRCMVEIFKFCD